MGAYERTFEAVKDAWIDYERKRVTANEKPDPLNMVRALSTTLAPVVVFRDQLVQVDERWHCADPCDGTSHTEDCQPEPIFALARGVVVSAVERCGRDYEHGAHSWREGPKEEPEIHRCDGLVDEDEDDVYVQDELLEQGAY